MSRRRERYICELCGKSTGPDYYSTADTDQTGEGLVLHRECCIRWEEHGARPPAASLSVRLPARHLVAVDATAEQAGATRAAWMRARLTESLGLEPRRLRALEAARALLEAARGGRGREPLTVIKVNLDTPGDLEAVNAAAEACGMAPSEWVRAVLVAHGGLEARAARSLASSALRLTRP